MSSSLPACTLRASLYSYTCKTSCCQPVVVSCVHRQRLTSRAQRTFHSAIAAQHSTSAMCTMRCTSRPHGRKLAVSCSAGKVVSVSLRKAVAFKPSVQPTDPQDGSSNQQQQGQGSAGTAQRTETRNASPYSSAAATKASSSPSAVSAPGSGSAEGSRSGSEAHGTDDKHVLRRHAAAQLVQEWFTAALRAQGPSHAASFASYASMASGADMGVGDALWMMQPNAVMEDHLGGILPRMHPSAHAHVCISDVVQGPAPSQHADGMAAWSAVDSICTDMHSDDDISSGSSSSSNGSSGRSSGSESSLPGRPVLFVHEQHGPHPSYCVLSRGRTAIARRMAHIASHVSSVRLTRVAVADHPLDPPGVTRMFMHTPHQPHHAPAYAAKEDAGHAAAGSATSAGPDQHARDEALSVLLASVSSFPGEEAAQCGYGMGAEVHVAWKAVLHRDKEGHDEETKGHGQEEAHAEGEEAHQVRCKHGHGKHVLHGRALFLLQPMQKAATTAGTASGGASAGVDDSGTAASMGLLINAVLLEPCAAKKRHYAHVHRAHADRHAHMAGIHASDAAFPATHADVHAPGQLQPPERPTGQHPSRMHQQHGKSEERGAGGREGQGRPGDGVRWRSDSE